VGQPDSGNDSREIARLRARKKCLPTYELRRTLFFVDADPVTTNPEHYSVVFENDRVRVLEYTDAAGDKTTPHEHPDSVMYTLSDFRRRLHAGDGHRDVELPAGKAVWLPAQRHSGENIGETATHVIFVELKDGTPDATDATDAQPGDWIGPA